MTDERPQRRTDQPDDLSVFEVQDTCGCGVPHGPDGHSRHSDAATEEEGPVPSALAALYVAAGAQLVARNGVNVAGHVPKGAKPAPLRLTDLSHLHQVALVGRSAQPDAALAAVTGTRLSPGQVAALSVPGTATEPALSGVAGHLDAHVFAALGCAAEVARLRAALSPGIMVKAVRNRSLVSLDGAGALDCVNRIGGSLAAGQAAEVALAGADVWAMAEAGGDRVILSVPEAAAPALARALLDTGTVALAGIRSD